MLSRNAKLTMLVLGGLAISPLAHHSVSGGGYRDENGVYHRAWEDADNPGRQLVLRLASGTKTVGDYRIPCRHCGRTDCLGCYGLRDCRPSCREHLREFSNELHTHGAHFHTVLANALGRPICADNHIHHRGIYPANPSYADPRDSRIYSAQGYGIPMSVPLAPIVKYQYNYGWGLPASRLTPVESTYGRYLPANWNGTPGDARRGTPQPPIVYAPTDTTQFGFYGKHIPSWQPVPRAAWGTEMGVVTTYGQPTSAPTVAPSSNGGVEVPAPTK